MNNLQKRMLLFLLGCIPLRLFLVYLAKTHLNLLKFMGYLGLILGLGFFTIFIFGLRKTGREVFGDKIWWNNLRPIHGLLWLTFGFFALRGNKNSWIILLVDIIIGFMAFIGHHFFSNA